MSNNPEKPKYEKVGEYVSIYQRGDKWYANFQVDGQQKRQSLKTTSKKEARRRALQIERDLVTGEFKSPKKAPTVEAVVTQYMAYQKGENRAPKTLTKYEKVLERVVELADRVHRRNILGIDPPFMDLYRQERAAAEISAKTAYCESVIIRQLVNFAMSRRLITNDSLKGVKIRKPKPTPQPCWTLAEVKQILAASAGSQQIAFMILAETGLRVGELKWLSWEDVDLEHNVLHVRPKDGWRPKSGDQRAVPISDGLRACLESHSRHARWVLTAATSAKHPSRERQMSERRLLTSLKSVLKKLGLRGHLHTFRHAFISRALSSGIPESQVKAWVGHVDSDIIKLYTHIADSQSQASMKKLNSSNDSGSNVNPQDNHKEVDDVAQSKIEEKTAQNQHNQTEPSDGLDAK